MDNCLSCRTIDEKSKTWKDLIEMSVQGKDNGRAKVSRSAMHSRIERLNENVCTETN